MRNRIHRAHAFTVARIVLSAAFFSCRPSEPTRTASPESAHAIARYDPSLDLGTLFADVQLSGIFPDSKTFVDARPHADPSELVRRYAVQQRAASFTLSAFVARQFELPSAPYPARSSDSAASMEEHIRGLWPVLTRQADIDDAHSTRIALPEPYVVPGGRFREVYYWDSYFTMLGLFESGRRDLVEHMLDNFAFLARTLGHIPNGNRSYYVSRSQPPYFAAMVALYARHAATDRALPYLDALEIEHRFWMDGADRLAPGNAALRVVRLANGAVLNRYWDERDDPRPESYRADVESARSLTDAERPAFYRNVRAAAESGWDFSSRWMRDPTNLRTLETTELIPIDLNSVLYDAEMILAELHRTRGRDGDVARADELTAMAAARQQALLAIAYDPITTFFYDVRFRTQERVIDRPSLAAAAPLFFGLATAEQGRAVADRLAREFLREGGFVTTLIASGQQWDSPNGWPPLQWLTMQGIARYGRSDVASEARTRWLRMNGAVYRATGKMTEKYDVTSVQRRAGGGEYPTQDGFGWTNGVALALLAQERAARDTEAPPPP